MGIVQCGATLRYGQLLMSTDLNKEKPSFPPLSIHNRLINRKLGQKEHKLSIPESKSPGSLETLTSVLESVFLSRK